MKIFDEIPTKTLTLAGIILAFIGSQITSESERRKMEETVDKKVDEKLKKIGIIE